MDIFGVCLEFVEKKFNGNAGFVYNRNENVMNASGRGFKTMHKNTILIIEDEPLLAELLAALAERQGLVPYLAPDGVEGLATAKTIAPDVILCDISMPGVDGFAVLRALRNHPRTQHTPVIMMTAYSEEYCAQDAARRGADAFLVKPFMMNQLGETIAEVLARYRRAV
ncbi:MAG: response regulator [Anaerolineae bacterium]|nr:response regulator [Anaerolineae bacterium]